jgi:Icc-related predicted phosphoesterase
MNETTKFVCISDTHSKHWDLTLPEGDVLLCAGDISYARKGDLKQEEEQLRDFSVWLNTLSYEHIVVIAGNHDFLFEHKKNVAIDILTDNNPNVHYLDQTSIEINDFKIYGEPRTPRFYDWAFNVSRSGMKDVWDLVPGDTDILLTHGPPLGYGDLVEEVGFDLFSGANKFINVGCKYQKDLIHNMNLKLVVSGHIHEGYGQWFKPQTSTHIVNASVVNRRYRPVNVPQVIELTNE